MRYTAAVWVHWPLVDKILYTIIFYMKVWYPLKLILLYLIIIVITYTIHICHEIIRKQ